MINDLTQAPITIKESTPTERENITATVESPAPIEYKALTELVQLPSKGLLYPPDSPLSSGMVEMKYMTTREEDILSTKSYLVDGTVLDRLFQSMIVTKFNYDDLLLGDRNAIMIAARMYGYGLAYDTNVVNGDGKAQAVSVDLSQIKFKEFDLSLITPGSNSFTFELPSTKNKIEFQLLTVGMQKLIEQTITANKKYAAKGAPEENLTTRLRFMIVSVDGNTNKGDILKFIHTMKASDSRAFREYIGKIQPDVDLTIEAVDESTGQPFRSQISLGLDLFWPDYKG